jgi:hypothetical protein
MQRTTRSTRRHQKGERGDWPFLSAPVEPAQDDAPLFSRCTGPGAGRTWSRSSSPGGYSKVRRSTSITTPSKSIFTDKSCQLVRPQGTTALTAAFGDVWSFAVEYARKSPFKHHCFPREVILCAVRRCLRYPLSYQDVIDLLTERGILMFDQTSITGCKSSALN